MTTSNASDRQRAHYERIHDAYEAHYYDAESLAYRERFILDPLLGGVDLSGRRLADLASGSGHNTTLLRRRYPDLDAVGFDISDDACRGYEANTGSPAHRLDLTRPNATEAFAGQFDAAIIVGGLHHCVSNLPATLDNIHALLRPGGQLLLFEPNAGYRLETLRTLWYERDTYFDSETERALTHDELVALAGDRFDVELVLHLGGPAYFLILNSLVMRVPHWLKRQIAAPSMAVEEVFNRHMGPRSCAYFVARWRRKA